MLEPCVEATVSMHCVLEFAQLCMFVHMESSCSELTHTPTHINSPSPSPLPSLSLSLSSAFTELQTDLADLVQISDDKNLPYRDFRSFAMRFLFPSAGADHPVLNPLAVADSSEVVPHLRTFNQLILDKKFLLLFVRTLEAQQGRFTLQDKWVSLSLSPSSFLIFTLFSSPSLSLQV